MTHRYLPKTTFGSVEYPGPVSHHARLLDVMHQQDMDECFNAPNAEQPVLEMAFRKGGGTVPVRGHRVGAAKMLVKIKRRRRRDEDEGVFVTEVMGTIPHSVRFRSMADHHYTPQDGPIAKVLQDLEGLNYDAFLNFSIPELDETFEADGQSLLDLQPPPMFSRTGLPANYAYKNSAQSKVQEVQDPRTGEINLRFVNRSREQHFGAQVIGHQHSPGDVPSEPTKQVKERMKRLKEPLIQKLQKIFAERPVWLRASLLSILTAEEQQEITSNRTYMATVAYIIGAGPFWKCYCRYGYDPCADPSARQYQRIYFYLRVARTKQQDGVETLEEVGPEEEEEVLDKGMTLNKQYRQKWQEAQRERVEKGERPPIDPSKGHIFDGQELNADRPDYQVCDIIDPLIRKYIDDPALHSDVCDSRDGWYKPSAIVLIRNLTKLKYAYIHEHNLAPPNEICYRTIEEFERELQLGRNVDTAVSGE